MNLKNNIFLHILLLHSIGVSAVTHLPTQINQSSENPERISKGRRLKKKLKKHNNVNKNDKQKKKYKKDKTFSKDQTFSSEFDESAHSIDQTYTSNMKSPTSSPLVQAPSLIQMRHNSGNLPHYYGQSQDSVIVPKKKKQKGKKKELGESSYDETTNEMKDASSLSSSLDENEVEKVESDSESEPEPMLVYKIANTRDFVDGIADLVSSELLDFEDD